MDTTKRSDRRGIAPLLALGIAAIIGVTAIGLKGCTPPSGDTVTVVVNRIQLPGGKEIDVSAGPTAPTTTTSVPPTNGTTPPVLASAPPVVESSPPPEETPQNVPEAGAAEPAQ